MEKEANADEKEVSQGSVAPEQSDDGDDDDDGQDASIENDDQEIDPNKSIKIMEEAMRHAKTPKLKKLLSEAIKQQRQVAQKYRQMEQSQHLTQMPQSMQHYVLAYEAAPNSQGQMVPCQAEYHIQASSESYPVIVQTLRPTPSSSRQRYETAEFAQGEALQEIRIEGQEDPDTNQEKNTSDPNWLSAASIDMQSATLSPKVHEHSNILEQEACNEIQASTESLEDAVLIDAAAASGASAPGK